MELTQLNQFRTIARCGTMTEAAEQLNLSQPALSTAIKKLEKELGAVLFDRQKNKVTLNDTGRLALQYTDRILSIAEEMKREVERRNSTLRMGICGDDVRAELPEILSALPQETILTISTLSDVNEGRKRLQKGALDILLSEEPVADVGLVMRTLQKGCLVTREERQDWLMSLSLVGGEADTRL